MAQTNKRKTVVRYDRIIAVAVIFIILIVLLVSCITSCGGDNSTGDSSSGKDNSVVSTDPASGTPGSTDPSGTDSTASVDPTGYKTAAMDAEAVYTGDLVVVNKDHEYHFPDNEDNLVSIYQNKLSTYQAKDWDTLLDKRVIEQFNALMEGYYSSTHNVDIMVISGYRSKAAQESMNKSKSSDVAAGYTEYHTGLNFNLGIFPKGKSSYYYKPEGDYKWISDNMSAYGFILRYPVDKDSVTGTKGSTYKFRYVGVPHAAYMTENSLCLEEYLEQLKSYTLQQPLDYEAGGKSYRIYYVPAEKSGSTDVSVPTDKEYSISGNNMDGFIVTVEMS